MTCVLPLLGVLRPKHENTTKISRPVMNLNIKLISVFILFIIIAVDICFGTCGYEVSTASADHHDLDYPGGA